MLEDPPSFYEGQRLLHASGNLEEATEGTMRLESTLLPAQKHAEEPFTPTPTKNVKLGAS